MKMGISNGRVPYWDVLNRHVAWRMVMGLFRVVVLVAGMSATGVTLVGCQTSSVEDHRVEAEKQWAGLRGQYRFQMATESIRSGHLNQAISALSDAIQFEPDNAVYRRTLGQCYLETGKLHSAEAELDAAEQQGDLSADLAFLRGVLDERRGDVASAIEQYREALHRDGTNRAYFQPLVETLVASGRVAEAAAMLDEHVESFDHHPDLLILRGRVRCITGEFELAVRDFEQTESRVATSAVLTEAYARALVKIGRDREALERLQPYLGGEASFTGVAQSGHGASWKRRGAARLNVRDGGGDASDISQSESGEDRRLTPSGVRLAAGCLGRLGKARQASALLEQHLRENPEDARGWYLLAEAALERGDDRAAMKCIERGMPIAPDVPHWSVLRERIETSRQIP